MSRRAHGWQQAVATVAALCVTAALIVAPMPQHTRAAFTDGAHGAAAVTSLRLQTPRITSVPTCSFTLSATPLIVEWRWDQPTAPDATSAGNVQWRLNGTIVSGTTTTGPDANGRYRTAFSVGLLSGLLGSLLGTSFVLEARTRPVQGATTWSSATVGRVDVTTGILGLNSRCPFTNGAQPRP